MRQPRSSRTQTGATPKSAPGPEKGGAHHAAWVTLGPLPGNKLLVRAYLFATDDTPEPLAMISFHHPIEHPEDIANNAGIDEDTGPCLVLPPDDVLQLNGFLTMLAAMAQGGTMPQPGVSSPR